MSAPQFATKRRFGIAVALERTSLLSRGDPFDPDEPCALSVEPTVPIPSNEADEIRRQMAFIRHDLHQDVRHVVSTAERVADWSRYIGQYSWVALGVAFGVGYLVVPKRQKLEVVPIEVSALPRTEGAAPESVTVLAKEPAAKEEKAGLLGAAMGLLAPLAVRAAQGYALKYLENWIAQQQFAPSGPPVHPGGPPTQPQARPRTLHP
jgi:hypothetical protein